MYVLQSTTTSSTPGLFELVTHKALSLGACGTFVEGCTFGVASGLIYAAEALLFYVSAVLIDHGMYSYLLMISEVLTLVMLSLQVYEARFCICYILAHCPQTLFSNINDDAI